MTPNELDFAIKVEEGLNRIPHPETRQLMVEALMVLSLVLDHEGKTFVNQVIPIDGIVAEANRLFLEHQVCMWNQSPSTLPYLCHSCEII